jgi:hypothetical protein
VRVKALAQRSVLVLNLCAHSIKRWSVFIYSRWTETQTMASHKSANRNWVGKLVFGWWCALYASVHIIHTDRCVQR